MPVYAKLPARSPAPGFLSRRRMRRTSCCLRCSSSCISTSIAFRTANGRSMKRHSGQPAPLADRCGGGACSKGLNVAAPPLIIYYLALGLAPAMMVQAMQICFLVGKSTQFAVLTLHGGVAAAQWVATLPFCAVAVAVKLVPGACARARPHRCRRVSPLGQAGARAQSRFCAARAIRLSLLARVELRLPHNKKGSRSSLFIFLLVGYLSSTFFSSPLSYISRRMSEPPTNSPFTVKLGGMVGQICELLDAPGGCPDSRAR